MPGFFIAFEGCDGSGKTTLVERFAEFLEQKDPSRPILCSREPGGTGLAEELRVTLKTPREDGEQLCSKSEALLLGLARRQHLTQKLRPALAEGKTVLCDRFIDSTYSYQSYAGDIPEKEYLELEQFVTDGFKPHLTVWLSCHPNVAMEHAQYRGDTSKDRFDSRPLSYFTEVWKGFHHRYRYLEPNRPMVEIEAFEDIYESCEKIYRKMLEIEQQRR